MTKIESIISFTAVFLVVFVMLFAPAFASGEPTGEIGTATSGEPFSAVSGEPSGEIGSVPSFGSGRAEIVADILFEAAGIDTVDDVSVLLANMDTAETAAELRSLLDMTQLMTDEQLREQIAALAAAYGYSFTDAEMDAIVRIIRSFEPLTVDELQARLAQMQEGYMAVEEIRDGLNSLGDRVQAFIQKLIELLRSIFSKDGTLFLPA